MTRDDDPVDDETDDTPRDTAESDDGTTTVIAQGTFDILHPGHLHYLTDAKAMGDELHVIVARRKNVTHKEPPILPDRQRRDMVAALEPVDEAHLGHTEDIFVPIERIDPDVIVLGHDQHHDDDAIRARVRVVDVLDLEWFAVLREDCGTH